MGLLNIDRVTADLRAYDARQTYMSKMQQRSADYIAVCVKRAMLAADTKAVSNIVEASDTTEQELYAALARFARAYMSKTDMLGAQAQLSGALMKGFAREAEAEWIELDQECF
jgi:flagellar biosynthesis regulator FlbT